MLVCPVPFVPRYHSFDLLHRLLQFEKEESSLGEVNHLLELVYDEDVSSWRREGKKTRSLTSRVCQASRERERARVVRVGERVGEEERERKRENAFDRVDKILLNSLVLSATTSTPRGASGARIVDPFRGA